MAAEKKIKNEDLGKKGKRKKTVEKLRGEKRDKTS